MNKQQRAENYAINKWREGFFNSRLEVEKDFLAGYEASEKNAEQERIKAKIDALQEIELGLRNGFNVHLLLENKINSLKTLLDNDRA